MRKPIIIGNWKMHKTADEVQSFADNINNQTIPQNIETAICAPYIYLTTLKEKLTNTSMGVGSQNVYWEEKGAFTGEISAPMLASLGVQYVIVGHSERRTLFGETDEAVNKKQKAVLQQNMVPIICVGETLEEREQDKTAQIVGKQIRKALEDTSAEEMKKIVIAYEPIWAIGTGKSATVEDAQLGISYIRGVIAHLFDAEVASHVRIQYGGSVTPENIHSYVMQKDIDGALVGGASLDATSFLQMVQAVSGISK